MVQWIYSYKASNRHGKPTYNYGIQYAYIYAKLEGIRGHQAEESPRKGILLYLSPLRGLVT